MNRSLLILALLACTLPVQGQGTIQFKATLTGANEVPPNTDPTIATATFTLQGNSLSFFVDVPAVTFISQNASIQGPALLGANGPIIFDLGGPTFRPGNSFGTPPSYRFFSPFTDPFGAGPFILTDEQITQLEGGLWYVNVTSAGQPDGQLRGQIVLADGDGDGVPDDLDQCPNTPAGEIGDPQGCSLDQLCPCDGPWKSHGEYVACFSRTAAQFQKDGLISEAERRNVVTAAIRSSCGKH